jgi:hypothetical protein
VLATGDIVVAPSPYAFGSYLEEWQRVLRKIIEIHPVAILPGHGSVQRNLEYVQNLVDLLGVVRQRVASCAKDGLSLDATIASGLRSLARFPTFLPAP